MTDCVPEWSNPQYCMAFDLVQVKSLYLVIVRPNTCLLLAFGAGSAHEWRGCIIETEKIVIFRVCDWSHSVSWLAIPE